jgi:hypothetical protein
LGQGCFIAQALQVLLLGMRNLVIGCVLGCDCSSIAISFHRRECQEKGLYHLQINCIGGNVLAHWDMVLLVQVVAKIAGTMVVLHNHFVSALSTVDDAV